MRMVVDVNYAKTPTLRWWLGSSKANEVVLIDVFAIESHRAGLEGLLANYATLMEYPTQVVVLLPSGRLSGLRARRKGAVRRMVDEAATSEFPKFCQHLRATPMDPTVRRQMEAKGVDAERFVQRAAASLVDAGNTLGGLSDMFSASDLKTIRKRQRYSIGAAKTFLDMVDRGFAMVAAGFPQARPRTMDETPNSYLYRLTLCTFLAAFTRIADGNPRAIAPDAARRDALDAYYCASALFFDGLWTRDRRARDILGHATALMRLVWGVECCPAHCWPSKEDGADSGPCLPA